MEAFQKLWWSRSACCLFWSGVRGQSLVLNPNATSFSKTSSVILPLSLICSRLRMNLFLTLFILYYKRAAEGNILSGIKNNNPCLSFLECSEWAILVLNPHATSPQCIRRIYSLLLKSGSYHHQASFFLNSPCLFWSVVSGLRLAPSS